MMQRMRINRNYASNFLWMLFEQLLRLVAGLVVGIYIAREVGPESYGIFVYGMSLLAMAMPFAKLGMENILLRGLMRKDEVQGNAASGFMLMEVGGVLAWSALCAFAAYRYGMSVTGICILVTATALLLQGFLVFEFIFQSRLDARKSSMVKSLALIFGIFIKIGLIFNGFGIVYIAVSYLLDHILIALGLYALAKFSRYPFRFSGFDFQSILGLLKSSVPMLLSALAISAYSNVDKMFIFNSLGSVGLGLYASATKLVEGLAMLVVVFCSAVMPILLKWRGSDERVYRKNIQRLFALFFWGGIIFSVFVWVCGAEIINILYGRGYEEAEKILVISVVSLIFLAFGSLSVRHLVVEGLERYLIIRSGAMLCFNLGFCWILVPQYGGSGAAVAVLASVIICNYLLDALGDKVRPLFWIKTKAIFLVGIW